MSEALTKMKPQAPDSDVDIAAGIEDEMRAQMLLKDTKMLENYLRVGFNVMLEKMPDTAETLRERAGRMKDKTAPVEALVQETRLRLTALAKSAPEQVSDTLKIIEIMIDQFEKRTKASEEIKKQDSTAKELSGMLKKDIWDMMMEQAHQGKKE